MKISLIAALLFLFSLSALSQQIIISGKITDEQNKAVPFASIYIKNTTIGTSANSEGEYSLHLKLGTYEIEYKAVGYKQESRNLNVATSQVVNVVLKTESYQLQNVVVGSGVDPAYAIIRKAIKKRKSHLDEVNAYTTEVYIKGMQKLLAAPKKFLGFDVQKATRDAGLDSNRRGIIYLSESQSKYSFMQPDREHEEMISSKVSGSNRAFSFNRASDMEVNFYKNIQVWEGLSTRPVISPIADNALFYYKYKYIGETVENGETIDKIQLIPKRDYDACFKGYIYVLEDSWRIYGLDLYITKQQSINFVDTLKISEQYFPVSPKIWMPSTIKFEFTGGLFSFKFGGYFISVYKDYDLNPTFTKNEFNEVLRISKGVNKKDSTYWQNERPVPLTTEEKTDYDKKAVLAKKRESKTYLDSLDKVSNEFHPGSLLLEGYHHRDRYRHEYYNLDPIISSVGFNTVQGFLISYGGNYSKLVDTLHNQYLVVGAKAGYGFSEKKFTGSVNTSIPVSSFRLGFDAGSIVTDLNDTYPITPLANAFHSLFRRDNYEKFYQKQYISASADKRIVDGWKASLSAEWADRTSLPNSSSYSFFDPNNRQYTSNNPFVPSQDVPLFPESQSFKIDFRTTYDFSDKYETYPEGKRYLPSPYPTIGLNYVKGINGFLGSDVNYDLLSFDITKSDISLGVLGRTSFYVAAGKFLNSSSLFYPDYQQFHGNEQIFFRDNLDSFLLLNYYDYSTYTEFIDAHLEHNFSGFILNKIPLIRKLKLQEIVDVNYLSTTMLKNYTELGFGLQYLNFRAMYGFSFNSGSNTHSGFRIGLNF